MHPVPVQLPGYADPVAAGLMSGRDPEGMFSILRSGAMGVGYV